MNLCTSGLRRWRRDNHQDSPGEAGESPGFIRGSVKRPVCAGPLPSQIVGGVKNRTLAAGPMAAFMRSTIATRSAVRSARV